MTETLNAAESLKRIYTSYTYSCNLVFLYSVIRTNVLTELF